MMKIKKPLAALLFFITMFSFVISAGAATTAARRPKPAQLQFPAEFIFAKVLERKNLTLRPDIENPKIMMASKTPLKQFQDAIESQWGFRPDVLTNAYVIHTNEIYLLDEAKYYKKTKRCMDDSLAHELTHFIQVKYKGYDLNDESLETDAVDVQTWFRETFCKIP